MTSATLPDELRTLLETLEPYADEFVVIGGWVPQLYRMFGEIAWTGQLARTTELDVVVRGSLPPRNRPHLRTLLESAGLRTRPGTSHSAIWERANDGADALELLTPRTGPITGPATTNIEEQPGVDAIVLSDLDLVMEFVAELRVPSVHRLVRVRVPTLGAYVATKAMTYTARIPRDDLTPERQKRGKDLLYIEDVMMAGADVCGRIERDLAEIVSRDGRFVERLRKARNNLALLRGASPHPALGEAAAMMAERDGVSPAAASGVILGAAEDLMEMLGISTGS